MGMITIILLLSGCTDRWEDSKCKDPIDENHRGLLWLSSGPLGQHLAIDFVAPEGTEVRAIADGHVEHYYPSMAYYGGCDGTPGPVLITRHAGGTKGSFAVQYGHVMTHLKDNESIFAGDVIGTGINYIPCCDTSEGCPHLHFAIWDSNTEHPISGMGFSPPRSFVETDWFFKNNLCTPCATADSGNK